MSSSPAHPASADTPGATARTPSCACCWRASAGRKHGRERSAGRWAIGCIARSGDAILDEVILRVDSRHRATGLRPAPRPRRHPDLGADLGRLRLDHRRGGQPGGLWAIIGAVCGGLYAYSAEHLLTKDELKRIGRRLPGDSSAIAAFVAAGDGRRVLASAEPCQPVRASVAAIGADLSAQVLTRAVPPVGSPPAAPGARPPDRDGSALSMLLVRYRGEKTARRELARHRPADGKHGHGVQTELIFEAPGQGRLKVSDPKQGAWALAKSDLISWGLFGVIYGLIVGLVSNHGAFSAIADTAAAGVVCAVFGLAAGALYGLWAGRAVSARR